MLKILGELEAKGGLKDFTALAEAILRVDESATGVEQKSMRRMARMVDHVLRQALNGEKSMAELVARIESVLEMLGGEPKAAAAVALPAGEPAVT